METAVVMLATHRCSWKTGWILGKKTL